MKKLVPLFADHLSLDLSVLKQIDKKEALILMVEVKEEADHVPHHRRKLVFLFSAMRHFAKSLKDNGYRVQYRKLDDPENTHSFRGEIESALKAHDIDRIDLTEPSEYRVLQEVKSWQKHFDCPVKIHADDRFIASHDRFKKWAEGRKSLRMEYFYREMRRETGLLMTNEKPEGGQWNYDLENRKPAKSDLLTPKPLHFDPDEITQNVLDMIKNEFPDRYGNCDDFGYAVTRKQAQKALDHFIDHALSSFGDYQDAMVTGEPFLYHSLLSAYLNIGLLGPLEICQAIEKAYKDKKAPLNAVEGYIRQVIGWREYVRGIYWMNMPGYLENNDLKADEKLPDYYWTTKTKMTCMEQALSQTRDFAYAHHIQRLMITGTFALISGINPHDLHIWYLSVYIDAFEWVEAPNTLGMSQFADGGLLASKPYAASGNYINKMSDYCGKCFYNVKERTGDKACPFNALYWDFIARHADRFKSNPRMAQMVRLWQRFDQDQQNKIKDHAQKLKSNLASL